MSQTPPLVLTPTMGGACRFGSTYSCSLDSRRGGLWWTESDTENSSIWTPHKSKTERNEGKYGDCIFSMSEIRLFRLNDSNSKNVDITLVDKAVKVNRSENGFICIELFPGLIVLTVCQGAIHSGPRKCFSPLLAFKIVVWLFVFLKATNSLCYNRYYILFWRFIEVWNGPIFPFSYKLLYV